MTNNNLTNLVCKTLNCTEDKALDFICDFHEAECLDVGIQWFNAFSDGFKANFDIDNKSQVLTEIGNEILQGNLREKDIEKLFIFHFPNDYVTKTDTDFFNGKMIIPHLKDTADPMSKRCNAVLCKVVLFNKGFVYLENQIDHTMYVVKTEDFE